MSEKQKVQIDWKNVGKLALILFLISAISALLLAGTNLLTKDAIAKQSEETNIAARQQVLPEADSFKAVEDLDAVAQKASPENASIVTEAYMGYKGDTLVGYTIKTTPNGYGGEVEVLTGIDQSGKVQGITILSHSETAGLGARSTEPEWQAQFSEKDATKDISVVKGGSATGNEIQAITGATITSKAVTLGVNTSDKVFEALVSGGQK